MSPALSQSSICEQCRCCEAYEITGAAPDDPQWRLCLWCADGVPCPNAQRKKKQALAQKAAAAVALPHHDHGVVHFASASKVSRAYQPRRTREVPHAIAIPVTHLNGDDMPKNNIEELRNDLFDTLRSLKGPVQPIDLQRAKAVCEVAAKIIDTGKLEVSAMRKVDQEPRTEFFGQSTPALPATAGDQNLHPRKLNGHAKH